MSRLPYEPYTSLKDHLQSGKQHLRNQPGGVHQPTRTYKQPNEGRKSSKSTVKAITNKINQVIAMCQGQNYEVTDEFKQVIKAQRGIYDLLIPNHESQLITTKTQNKRKPYIPFEQINDPIATSIPTKNYQNPLGDQAIFMIQQIQRKALQEIQILRNQKNQLIQQLNIQINLYQQEKKRRIWLENQLEIVANHLKNQGIMIYPNGLPFRKNQTLSAPVESVVNHQRKPSKTLNLPDSADQFAYRRNLLEDNQPYIRNQYPQQDRFANEQLYDYYGNDLTSQQYPSYYNTRLNTRVDPKFDYRNDYNRRIEPRNDPRLEVRNNPLINPNDNIRPKLSNQQIEQNLLADNNLRDPSINLRLRLSQGEQKANFYKQQIQRIKGSQGNPSDLYNLLLELLEQGQKIRKQTIKLLKAKEGKARYGEDGDRVKELEKKLQQQQKNKQAFLGDLQRFKQKYKQIEEENIRLKEEKWRSQTNIEEPKRKYNRIGEYQNVVSQIKKLSSL